MTDARVRRVRRYYLLTAQAYGELDMPGIRALNYGQQQAESGIVLPADFPGLKKANCRQYFTAEDFDGACRDEFVCLGFTDKEVRDAQARLVALGYGQPWTIVFDPWALILRPLSTSALGASSGTTPVLDIGSQAKGPLSVTLNVGTASGSAPVLTVALEASSDGLSWSALAAFANSSVANVQALHLTPPRYVRADWSITGADSSFAFALTGRTHP